MPPSLRVAWSSWIVSWMSVRTDDGAVTVVVCRPTSTVTASAQSGSGRPRQSEIGKPRHATGQSSEVVGSPTNLAAGSTEDEQDQSDDREHDADGPQDRDFQDEADDQKDDAECDHADSQLWWQHTSRPEVVSVTPQRFISGRIGRHQNAHPRHPYRSHRWRAACAQTEFQTHPLTRTLRVVSTAGCPDQRLPHGSAVRPSRSARDHADAWLID